MYRPRARQRCTNSLPFLFTARSGLFLCVGVFITFRGVCPNICIFPLLFMQSGSVPVLALNLHTVAHVPGPGNG
uniref:Uncharacterized protein n=1 Tax=Anguilla anguilla TaxID=7936 RepID=A0A0E9UDU8_ANGAN